jgi:hypothetical protein
MIFLFGYLVLIVFGILVFIFIVKARAYPAETMPRCIQIAFNNLFREKIWIPFHVEIGSAWIEIKSEKDWFEIIKEYGRIFCIDDIDAENILLSMQMCFPPNYFSNDILSSGIITLQEWMNRNHNNRGVINGFCRYHV